MPDSQELDGHDTRVAAAPFGLGRLFRTFGGSLAGAMQKRLRAGAMGNDSAYRIYAIEEEQLSFAGKSLNGLWWSCGERLRYHLGD